MHAAQPRTALAVDAEGLIQLARDVVEGACLQAIARALGIAVHGVGEPQHRLARLAHGLDDGGQVSGNLAHAHAVDQHHLAFLLPWVERLAQRQHPGRIHGRAHLHADGVGDATAVLDVCAVKCGGAQTDPREVRGEIEPARLAWDLSGLRLFRPQQECFVRGVEIHPLQIGKRLARQRFHEAQRVADGIHTRLVFGRKRSVLHPVEVPVFRVVQIREAAVDEAAHEVDGHRRARVRFEQALRIGDARLGRELRRVDQVAAITRQRQAIPGFGIGRARLGVLPGKAANAGDALLQAMRQHEAHLQQDLEAVGDQLGAAIGKALGAVAALQHEAFAARRSRELALEAIHFPGSHQGRQALERGDGGIECPAVGIGRLLHDGFRLPAVGGPVHQVFPGGMPV